MFGTLVKGPLKNMNFESGVFKHRSNNRKKNTKNMGHANSISDGVWHCKLPLSLISLFI